MNHSVLAYWFQFNGQNLHTFHILVGSLHLIIGLIGSILNLFILYFFAQVKKKKNSTSYFIINLAIVNIVTLFVNVPMSSISSFNGHWMFQKLGCTLYGISGGLFGFVSISTMVLMSIERYLIIKDPFLTLKMNRKFLAFCFLIIWLYSSIWVVLPLFSENGYVLEGALTSCSFDYLDRGLFARISMLLMVLFGFVFPMLIVSVFYILVWRSLNSRNRRLNSGGETAVAMAADSASSLLIGGHCRNRSPTVLNNSRRLIFRSNNNKQLLNQLNSSNNNSGDNYMLKDLSQHLASKNRNATFIVNDFRGSRISNSLLSNNSNRLSNRGSSSTFINNNNNNNNNNNTHQNKKKPILVTMASSSGSMAGYQRNRYETVTNATAANFDSVLYRPKEFNSLYSKTEIKITKTLIAFVLVFLLTWLPYSVMTLYAQFGTNLTQYITPVTASVPALFAKLSSILNPFIFVLKSSECKFFIRRQIIKLKH